MPRASDLKRGMVVELDGVPHIVKELEAKSPSSRGASTLYKVRFNNLLTGQKRDKSFKGEDMLKEADCQRVQVQFSYMDNDQYIFMDLADFSQHALDVNTLEGQVEYITEGLEGITALIVDGTIAGIDLPQSVLLKIEETTPSIKGATANARTKPATLVTGLVVQVPEYIETGELIKVNTTNGRFMSRA